ncbi:MAG: FAD-dependent oxidoreductase [Isosphaeraceae bacterium]
MQSRDSAWMADVPERKGNPLERDVTVDVCVIGGGLAGMTSAYLLRRAGKSVAVLDQGPLAGGNTRRTTAHLSNAIDDRYVEVERIHGSDGARLAAESHTGAIRRIEEIVQQERIGCDFERLDGYLFVPAGESPELLDRELAAAHAAGLAGVEKMARAPWPSFETGPCLRFPDQGQFHPLRYIDGLGRAVLRDGGRIHTDTHVDRIDGGTIARVCTAAGPVVSALFVVVATNSPFNDLVAIHTKQAPYLTYAIGAAVPLGSVPKGLYWDTLDPYHYVRLAPMASGGESSSREGAQDRELLIVGGEDHKTGQADDQEARFGRLEAWARERFPMVEEVPFRWSGQVMETIDGLAFIGRNPGDRENVFIITGDSGMGMTHGTIGGMIVSDLILGRENPWAKLYDPSRKPVGAARDFASENLNVAGQYARWLTGGEVSDRSEIPVGEGAVIRRGLKKLAVYRDGEDLYRECSAVCPHLGCIVAWNSAEKTWDCPCHGSRFDRSGELINAPANRGLEPHGE